MLRTTRRGWGLAFIQPDLVELMRDFIMSGKADAFSITKPDWLPGYATEEFLYHHGYSQQIVEIRQARHERMKSAAAQAKNEGLDYLSEEQRETVLSLMKMRKLPEKDAVKWVIEHPDEVRKIWSM